MRVRVFFRLLFGILLIGVCAFAAWRSVRIARADWLASKGTAEGFDRAIAIMPDEPELLARAALFQADNDIGGNPGNGARVDRDLERAARLNPLNSALMMTIGLREEFRGNNAAAGQWLARAAEIDHQFKPAWTLANFYFRRNEPEKSWPMIARILNLEPLGFDTAPVFALAWKMAPADGKDPDGKDSANARILRIMPKRGRRTVEYLSFLMASKRTGAAMEVWPAALRAADPGDPGGTAILKQFAQSLEAANRIADAVAVWNQMVDRGVIRSGKLDPAKGVSIANPDFQFAPENGTAAQPGVEAFGWQVADIPGVYASRLSGVMRFEINGQEPESFAFLAANAPVLPGTRYRLTWKTDATGLSEPQDPGFRFHIVERPPDEGRSDPGVECPPLLAPAGAHGCEFETPKGGGMTSVRLELGYTRALGTTRISGVLEMLGARLQPIGAPEKPAAEKTR